MTAAVDYRRLDYEWSRHHIRFVRRVEKMPRKLPCQACKGWGGEIEPVLDFGEGPWYDCGWCEGTGLVTPWLRGFWLRVCRVEKRKSRAPLTVKEPTV